MTARTPSSRSGKHTDGRSAARLAAVQALYQIEMNQGEPEDVIEEFLEHRTDQAPEEGGIAGADPELFTLLVRGIIEEEEDIDDMLSAVLDSEWPLQRLERLLRLLLRAGVYEIAERRALPARVAIAEYLALADAFFSGSEPGLVNGVLDRVGRALRPEEFEPQTPAAGGGRR